MLKDKFTPTSYLGWWEESKALPGRALASKVTKLNKDMPETIEQAIARVSAELGHPGIDALFVALKRRRINATRKQVQDYVKQKSEKQVFAPPQRASGKTISEDDNRIMADLIDVSNVPAKPYKFFLVVVNVFDRYLYARPLTTKNPTTVAPKLKDIIQTIAAEERKKPQILSSDAGAEFTGAVSDMLQKQGIVQRWKDAGDLNSLGLLDRTIGLLKRKLAEMHASNKKSWATNLPAAVKALNETPKPNVLHGAAPKDVHEDPEVTFMLSQDMARNIAHNQRTTEQKQSALSTAGGTFRAQTAVNKYKRNFQATYSHPQQAERVEAGRVYTSSGETYPLKQVKIVPVGATRVQSIDAQRKLRDGGSRILRALAEILKDKEGEMAISEAAKAVRAQFKENRENYDELLATVRATLVELIRTGAKFKLTRPASSTYYVALA